MPEEPTSILSGLATWSGGSPAHQLACMILLQATRDLRQVPRPLKSKVWQWLQSAEAEMLFDAVDFDHEASLAALKQQMLEAVT